MRRLKGLEAYLAGFILSLLLTVTAFICVINKVFTGRILVLTVIALAIAQLLVQLVFFLHLANEKKPRLNLLVFGFMLLVVGIIVGGSLWIMQHLDYNMMPHQMDEHMLDQYEKGGI